MRKSLFVILVLLNIGQILAQNPIRLKYRLLFQSSNNLLNTFPTDSTVPFYPSQLSTLADENIIFNKTLATQPYDSTSKTIFTYDQNGNAIRDVRMRRIGGGPWENFYKQERLYDTNGKLLNYSFFSCMNGLWKETRYTRWDYNTAGQETWRLERDTVAGVLTDREAFTTQYDSLNRKKYFVWSKFENGGFVVYSGDTYHYKGSSTMIDSVEHKFRDPNTNNLKKTGRSLYIYNGQGQLVQQIRQQLQGTNYTNNSMVEFGYDNFGNKNATVSFNWDSSNNSWRPNFGDYYTFDVQGRTIENVIKQLDNNTNQLKNVGRTQTTFSSDSSIIIETGANWINDAWVVLYKNEWVFERVGVTSLEDFSENKATLEAYPNPFTDYTIIDFKATQSAEANICVYDFSGRLVYSKKQSVIAGNNSFLWEAVDKNGNALPSGMYFLSLSTSTNQQSFKLIKQ
jgi:hypothetical protein